MKYMRLAAIANVRKNELMATVNAADQWRKAIENFPQKGVGSEKAPRRRSL